jgi:hypothetical protein
MQAASLKSLQSLMTVLGLLDSLSTSRVIWILDVSVLIHE